MDKNDNGPMLFCGDPHGQWQHIIDAALETQASAVILLGDLEPARPLHIELEPILDLVWFIHGNHDTDTETHFSHVWDSALAHRSLDGKVVTLPNGTRIAGLGGVFRGTVWNPKSKRAANFRNQAQHVASTPRQDKWRGGVHRRHWSSIYPDDVERLATQQADILITHEAPGYHEHGFDVLDGLAQKMGVKLAVHGHQHDNKDSSARWPHQRFMSFGVGLRGVMSIDLAGHARSIVGGELDGQATGI
jgi:predicted phosphodiesterase